MLLYVVKHTNSPENTALQGHKNLKQKETKVGKSTEIASPLPSKRDFQYRQMLIKALRVLL